MASASSPLDSSVSSGYSQSSGSSDGLSGLGGGMVRADTGDTATRHTTSSGNDMLEERSQRSSSTR